VGLGAIAIEANTARRRFPSGHPSKSKSDLKLVCGTTVEIRPLIVGLTGIYAGWIAVSISLL
jgi:hypothetical protein